MKRNFTHLELLQNSDFIHWMRTDEERSFSWSEWVRSSPENEKNYLLARYILQIIEKRDIENIDEKLSNLWDEIEKKIEGKSAGDSDR